MKQLLWIACACIGLVTACKKSEKPALAVVVTTTPTNVTASSAQTGGDITNTGGSPISQSGICWALQNTPTVGDSVINSGQTGAGTFVSAMTNLNANTTYYVRAFAINGIGTAYGVVDSFVTAQGVPTVATTAISNNAALAAQSGGDITNNGGASVTVSGICWSTSANPTVSNFKTVGTAATGPFVDTLSSLTLGATYYVRAYATNSYGTGYGNQVSFTVSSTGTVSDIDGNAYPTVTIGTQTWMAANLRVTHYQNGDTVENAYYASGYNWLTSTTGVYTFVNLDSTTRPTYGLLYSLWAVNDSRNIAPAGWHVATQTDWDIMEIYEGFPVADTSVLGLNGTISPLLQVGGSSGLNLQLSGNWFQTEIENFGVRGYFWTSTPASSTTNWLEEFYGPTSPNYQGINTNYAYGEGFSVRCVHD